MLRLTHVQRVDTLSYAENLQIAVLVLAISIPDFQSDGVGLNPTYCSSFRLPLMDCQKLRAPVER